MKKHDMLNLKGLVRKQSAFLLIMSYILEDTFFAALQFFLSCPRSKFKKILERNRKLRNLFKDATHEIWRVHSIFLSTDEPINRRELWPHKF